MAVIGFQLPELATFDDEKLMRQHRKQEYAEYERVFVTEGIRYRYYSDEPLCCVGEYIKSNFNSRKDLKNILSYVYVEEVDKNVVYALFVKNDGVVSEEYCDYQELVKKFTYHAYTTRLCSNQESILNLFVDIKDDRKLLIDGVNTKDIPSEFKLVSLLKSVSRSNVVKKAILGSIFVSLVGAFGYYGLGFINPPPPPPPPPPVNPVALWKKDLATKIPASSVFQNSAYAIAEFMLMPPDWKIYEVGFKRGELTLDISATGSSSLMVNLNEWMSQNSFIKDNFDMSSMRFSFEVTDKPEETFFVLGNYTIQLVDTFKILGANSVGMKESKSIGDIGQYKYSVSFSGVDFSLLLTLADYFKDKPFFIDSLNVNSVSNGVVSFEFEATLQGIQNDEI
ncbi:hypothetical protein ACTTZI_004173 [Vibrio vulnificus]